MCPSSPMATQIHTYPTRGTTRSRQIRDIILSFIHVVPSLWTSGIGFKKLASPTIIQSVTFDSLTTVRHGLALY